jgi:hypothetical protein
MFKQSDIDRNSILSYVNEKPSMPMSSRKQLDEFNDDIKLLLPNPISKLNSKYFPENNFHRRNNSTIEGVFKTMKPSQL